ncbi:MAG: class I SAM-dependent methyltransferase, partial [Vicinamibacterales bacterium]
MPHRERGGGIGQTNPIDRMNPPKTHHEGDFMTATATATDIDALKARLKATWMDGDYDTFSRYLESSAIEFLDRLDITPGARLLDVACGSGQLGLFAARRGVRVTGVDIATNSIQIARRRAAEAGLDARFDEGDAEAL